MTSDHSSKQYDMDLESIRSKVLLMGGLVESHFHDAMACYRSVNGEQAQQVIDADLQVNQLEVSLDDMCSHLIVKRQPAANDLRTVMATGKVITDLERIGDEATKIARIAHETAANGRRANLFSGYDTVRVLANNVADMLHRSLDAFARLDKVEAGRIIAQDSIIDHDFRTIVRNLITFMMEDPSTISSSVNTIWVAKAIERIGDHSKNIAEHTIYIIDGKDIRHSDYAAQLQDQQK